MSKDKNIEKILLRSGTGQNERFVKALDPENFELHDFTVEDWILFAYDFAKNVNYFSTTNSETPSDDWQCFFSDLELNNTIVPSRTKKEYGKIKENITEVLSEFKNTNNLTPHLTLFVCFLQLLELSKDRLNALTKRHLDFYYKEILQVDKNAAIEDQAHVIFELARKTIEQQITKETELDADKDADGNPLIYKTDEELIVNKSKVAQLKTIYNGNTFSDPKHKGDNEREFKVSQAANTLDGIEEPLPEESPYWYPFGYTSAEEENYGKLETGELGFALSSPILSLEEGLRRVEITIEFEEDDTEDAKKLSDFDEDGLKEIFDIYGSGSKKWIGPFELDTTVDESIEVSKRLMTKVASETKIRLAFELSRDEDALVNYNEELLLRKYNTSFPLVRFLIDAGNKKGYEFYQAIAQREVKTITIKVDVKEAKNIEAENDNGIVKTAKPFYPFSTQPIKSSNFYINHPEAFSKKWKSLKVNMVWKNTPDSFKNWYKAYINTQRLGTKQSTYKSQIKIINTSELIVKGNNHFKAKKSLLHKEIWEDAGKDQVLFTNVVDPVTEKVTSAFETNIEFTSSKDQYHVDKTGPIRLSLKESFLHEMFPRLYALALMTDGALIPNEPYTPQVESIHIDYTAEESLTITSQTLPIAKDNPLEATNNEEAYLDNRIKLFHEHPFGVSEEHNYLKISRQEKGIKDQYDTDEVTTSLVPFYCKGGELLIGIEEAVVDQTLTLLLQVLEGSENPLVPTFKENEGVNWSVLCNNGWKDLKEYIISDNTGNFLTSGIIKFSIPKEATSDNTLLPENLMWFRARMHKDYDAVCKMINIHTQAVLATFENDSNNLSHLEKGLPASTIKKLITRIPQIKKIEQPYTSFGGITEESDIAFYRRISERLRHKNRAITLWDYEHLILQEFPEIYKVKCLNHTKEDNFTAPGEVTLVVIPDTVDKNVFDIYEPRVSTGLINKVESYINKLNSLHVDAKVINPNYEKITITLEVSFHEGLDKSFYAKKLEDDIKKYLSPWAYDETKEIVFGVTLHRSVLIDYLEKLDYVDYLQNVSMKKKEEKSQVNISPSNPTSILVSAKEHNISTVLTTCKGDKEEPQKTCQA